ncbi:MAG TPA: hypothetical protein VFE48_16195 [Methylomirabilota bacterium]|nr:hypothetical protein [Methylomirabilota bacterium]
MSNLRLFALILGLLAATAVLISTAPATAHEAPWVVTSPPAATTRASGHTAPTITPVAPVSTPAPEGDALTPLLIAGALVLVGLALRRAARRALLMSLVLLLSVFAFEDALHSVHHGFDPQQVQTCTIAAASGHVSGVAVDGVTAASIVLVPVGRAVELDLSPLPLHRLAPEQGRAPPAVPA